MLAIRTKRCENHNLGCISKQWRLGLGSSLLYCKNTNSAFYHYHKEGVLLLQIPLGSPPPSSFSMCLTSVSNDSLPST